MEVHYTLKEIKQIMIEYREVCQILDRYRRNETSLEEVNRSFDQYQNKVPSNIREMFTIETSVASMIDSAKREKARLDSRVKNLTWPFA